MPASAPSEAPALRKEVFDNAGAKRELYETHRSLVSFVVSQKLRGLPTEEAEDVASALWAKLFDGRNGALAGFASRAKFSTWLSKVALNAARDHLRRNRIEYVSLDEVRDGGEGTYTLHDVIGHRSPQPLDRLLARERRSEVSAAIRGLPKPYREVVFARFYREWTVPEIAQRFGIAEDTVYVRLHRAFRKLRKALGEHDGSRCRGSSLKGGQVMAGKMLTKEELDAAVGVIGGRYLKDAHRLVRYRRKLLRAVLEAWATTGKEKVIYFCENGMPLVDEPRLTVTEEGGGQDWDGILAMAADLLPSLYRRYRLAVARHEADSRELEFLDELYQLVLKPLRGHSGGVAAG